MAPSSRSVLPRYFYPPLPQTEEERPQIPQKPQTKKGSLLRFACIALGVSLTRSYTPLLSSQLSLGPTTATDLAVWPSWGLSLRGERVEPSPAPSHLASSQPTPEGRRSASSPDSLSLDLMHFPSLPLNKEFEPHHYL